MSFNHLVITVTTSPIYQGYAAFFTVTAYSSADNSVIDTSFAGTIAFTPNYFTFYDANNPNVPITSYTFTSSDNGVHNFAVIDDILGFHTFTISIDDSYSTTGNLTVIAGAPTFGNCCQMNCCKMNC